MLSDKSETDEKHEKKESSYGATAKDRRYCRVLELKQIT